MQRLHGLLTGLWIGLGLTGVAQADALRGHGGPVMGVLVTPDGSRALTAGFDNAVGLWSLADDSVRWLDGHTAAVRALALIDADHAASGGADFAVRTWDLTTGTETHQLKGHQGQIADLAVSPDGTRLASASWDGSVGLWNAATGTPLAMLAAPGGAVNAVVFSGDGATLYSGSADGGIRVWEVATGDLRRTMLQHGFGVNRLLIDPNGGWLAYGAVDGGLKVIDLVTDAVLADLSGTRRPILSLAVSPDGSAIAAGDGDGYVMTAATAGWTVTADFRVAATGPIWALAYVGDDRLLVAGLDNAAWIIPATGPDVPPIGQEPRDFQTDPAELSNGARQFQRKCSICHTLSGDGGRRAGPTLAGLFGRPAGSLPDYRYSEMMAGSGIVWSAQTLDRLFDEGPAHYVPGSKMPMQRIAGTDDRRDLIAYLRDNT